MLGLETSGCGLEMPGLDFETSGHGLEMPGLDLEVPVLVNNTDPGSAGWKTCGLPRAPKTIVWIAYFLSTVVFAAPFIPKL